MEGQEATVNGGMSNGVRVASSGNVLEKVCSVNGSVQADINEKVEGNVAEVLEDWEQYWEDISDRLMVSRMVSDSVIKGMVIAVEEEAAEKIAAKELELANLKKCLDSREVGTCKFEDVRLPIVHKIYEVGKYGKFSCSVEACKNNEKTREDLNALRDLVKEQFEKFKKEIETVKGSNSLKKIGSGSALVGLGGILHEKQSESWVLANKMLDSLKTTLDTVCSKVDEILLSLNVSFCESQLDLDLSSTLDDGVKQTALMSLQEEFEENLLEQSVQFWGTQNMNWIEKFNDISSVGTKLDAILRSLSLHETELVTHGSHDLDNFLHKTFENHVTPPIEHNGENGAIDASNIHITESYNFEQLKHMSKEELVDYFNDIITKMKRDHESALHQKTEEYFCLKREYLKLKGSFPIDRKDEEFDVLRKKIPEVISKLENFFLENERFPALTNSIECVGKLKHRLESLLPENRDLRDRLIDKENEVKHLKAQVSGASAELLQHSVAKENFLKLVENLKSEVEDSHIEASLNKEVYKCVFKEQIAQTRCDSEDSIMEFVMTREIYDIILSEAAIPPENPDLYGIDDSDVESFIMQELNGLILTKAIRNARGQLGDLCLKVIIAEDNRVCLERRVLEKENELRLEVEEKEKLKQEILDLQKTLEQKEKFVMDLSVSLSQVREKFEVASQELSSLREHASQQYALVTKRNKDMESLTSQHLEALEQIEVDKMELHKLSQKLDQTKMVLAEARKERDRAFDVAEERNDELQLNRAREQTLKKEIEIAANGFSNIFDDFECRVSRSIERNSLRLKGTSSDSKSLTEMANVLRRTMLMYRNKHEKRYTDLQMAESEVDLLGDEVDALSRLLEKIYIALDHYSPVLKHYPGIIEILELVKRELTGQSTLLP